MKLPKDAIVFIGVWALHHDDTYWDHPEEFRPERYKDHDRLASYYAGSPDYMQRDKSPACHLTHEA